MKTARVYCDASLDPTARAVGLGVYITMSKGGMDGGGYKDRRVLVASWPTVPEQTGRPKIGAEELRAIELGLGLYLQVGFRADRVLVFSDAQGEVRSIHRGKARALTVIEAARRIGFGVSFHWVGRQHNKANGPARHAMGRARAMLARDPEQLPLLRQSIEKPVELGRWRVN